MSGAALPRNQRGEAAAELLDHSIEPLDRRMIVSDQDSEAELCAKSRKPGREECRDGEQEYRQDLRVAK